MKGSKQVAIVGFDCVAPKSDNPDELWDILKNKIHPISAPIENRYPNYSLQGDSFKYGLVNKISNFDAPKYGISKEEAKYLDPQHRVVLELLYRSLDKFDLRSEYENTNSSVYIGISSSDYANLINTYINGKKISPYCITGNAHSTLPGRIANLLNINGQTEVVDTACASSSSAVYHAYLDIANGKCQRAIAGGVNLILDDNITRSLDKIGIISPNHACKAFSSDANGYVRSEGAVVFYLKELQQAYMDKNEVFGIIIGGSSNHNGRSNGLTSPNPRAQINLLKEATLSANIKPNEVAYVECHGTGTYIGDRIELQSIVQSLDVKNRKSPLLVGSIKSNIGHLETAAGGIGLIKLLMSFSKKRIPANHHCDNLINIATENEFIKILTEDHTIEPSNAGKYIVNSFGFSGSNCSLVIAPPDEISKHDFQHGELSTSNVSHWFNDDETISVPAVRSEYSVDNIRDFLIKLVEDLCEIWLIDNDYDKKISELGIDSLALIDIICSIEKKFDISCSLPHISGEIKTFNEFVLYVYKLINNNLVTTKADIGKQLTSSSTKNVINKKIKIKSKNLESIINNYLKKTQKSLRNSQKQKKYVAAPINMIGYSEQLKQVYYPITLTKVLGAKVYDIDGNEYIDCMMEYGANIFGHLPKMFEKLTFDANDLMPLGSVKKDSEYVANKICELTNYDRVTFLSTGSEAVMNAIRIARTYTNKEKVVVFSWSYHGAHDQILCSPIVRLTGEATPLTLGIPTGSLSNTIVLEYGSAASLNFITEHQDEIAAILVEPIQSRQPHIQPSDFLLKLREIVDSRSTLLIFDEVITGFRFAKGGASEFFNIQPDLSVYGKIIGGGLPLAAVAGKKEYLDITDGGCYEYQDTLQSPQEIKCFVGGTYNESSLSMKMARIILGMISRLTDEDYKNLNQKAESMCEAINNFFKEVNASLECLYSGSLFRFSSTKDIELFYFLLKKNGLYISPVRNCFIGFSHSSQDINSILNIVKDSTREFMGIYNSDIDDYSRLTAISNTNKKKVILCFKFVGGIIDSYISVLSGLENEYDIFYVDYDTKNDFDIESMKIYEKIIDQFQDSDLYFIGHSMGALMAYRVAVNLYKLSDKDISDLIISGERSPDNLYDEYIDLSKRDIDSAILKFLSNADPRLYEVIKSNSSIKGYVLDNIQEEVRFFFTQENIDLIKLNTPISLIRGKSDLLVLKEHITNWKKFTNAGITKSIAIEGGHNYFIKNHIELKNELQNLLLINKTKEATHVS